MLSSCGDDGQSKKHQSLMEASKQELASALEERDQLLLLVNEISSGMEQIKNLEHILTINGNRALENPAKRRQLLSDMEAVKKTLQKRREKLAELETRIKNSTLSNEELQKSIEALRGLIDSQAQKLKQLNGLLSSATAKIDSLNLEVDSLNSTVATVNHNLDSVQAASARLANELNSCYYVIATKNQLKKHQIIGTAFLRKTKLLEGDFDKDFFVIGDKRNLRDIDLHSRKVKMYTNHPRDSYEIIETDNSKRLNITNPEKFWSLSNYLVIQID